MERLYCSAIVCAAGSSRRNGGVDKLSAVLGGMTVLSRTLLLLDRVKTIDEVVVVTREDRIFEIESLCKGLLSKPYRIVTGGNTRARSSYLGICAARGELVAIHDGARPFLRVEDAEKVIADGEKFGAAVLCIPARDTVKVVSDETVTDTPDRSRLWNAQTPQVFLKDTVKRGYESAFEKQIDLTDDCAAAELAGARVHITEGHSDNLKLTYPEDFMLAQGLLNRPSVRVGHGYDVHKLTENRRLVLCGVEIPFEKGLLGHSDADVSTHALMDAMLGALSLGDIGHLFPDRDPAYEGADSTKLLFSVNNKIREAGYRLSNADITILCQRPKLAPYIGKMKKRLAEVLSVEENAVSIKATTEEGLGFTGSGEGIAAHAVCLLEEI